MKAIRIPMTTNIFGTEYKINLVKEPNEWMYENNAEGYTDFENKEIYIRDCDRKKPIYWHELIHAHLWEAGLKRYATNEDLVEILSEILIRISNMKI